MEFFDINNSSFIINPFSFQVKIMSAPPSASPTAPPPSVPSNNGNNGSAATINNSPVKPSEPVKETPPVSQPMPASKPPGPTSNLIKPMVPGVETNNANKVEPPKESNGDTSKLPISGFAPNLQMTDAQKKFPRPFVGPPPPTTARVAPVIPHM